MEPAPEPAMMVEHEDDGMEGHEDDGMEGHEEMVEAEEMIEAEEMEMPAVVVPVPDVTADVTEVEVEPVSALASTEWKLTLYHSMEGEEQNDHVDATIVTLIAKNGVISGSTGCNDYKATYIGGIGNNVTITPGPTTGKACADVAMDIETRFLAELPKVKSYRIEGESLYLMTAEGEYMYFDPLQ